MSTVSSAQILVWIENLGVSGQFVAMVLKGKKRSKMAKSSALYVQRERPWGSPGPEFVRLALTSIRGTWNGTDFV